MIISRKFNSASCIQICFHFIYSCIKLRYPEAEIISRCYSINNVMWGKAIIRHYVINGEDDYLNKFLHRHVVTSTLVEEGLAAFESESGFSKKPELLHRLSCFVSKLPGLLNIISFFSKSFETNHLCIFLTFFLFEIIRCRITIPDRISLRIAEKISWRLALFIGSALP